MVKGVLPKKKFQHTAARRRLVGHICHATKQSAGFNTQPPEGGWLGFAYIVPYRNVSTHSRPKAAGNKWNIF